MEKKEIIPNNSEDKKSFWRKAKDTMVKAVDQNDDGTFDKEDISAIAESIGNSAKSTYESVKMKAEAHRLEKERKQLAPIFTDDIADQNCFFSKLLRVTTIDKKRAESDVCRDSIGYHTEQKDFKIVNLYKDKLSESGLSFFPNAESELYYVDPIDNKRYIAFEQYFSYLKEARVNELELIAQALGAKHFKVSFKGAKSSSEHFSAKHTLKAGKKRAVPKLIVKARLVKPAQSRSQLSPLSPDMPLFGLNCIICNTNRAYRPLLRKECTQIPLFSIRNTQSNSVIPPV